MPDQASPRGASMDLPADLVRPSSLSLRPHLNVTTRMRARSVTSGAGSSSTPTLPYLSPTLAGSPVLPSFDTFLADAHHAPPGPSALGASFLSRERARGSQARDDSGDSDDPDADDEAAPSLEGDGSTESESPPHTPVEATTVKPLPLFRVSPGDDEQWGPYAREKRRGIEGTTRIGVRRGRSFTSLLMPALGSPVAVERQDPIAEMTTPPLSDLESGEPDRPAAKGTTAYPPAQALPSTAAVAPIKSIRNFAPQVALLGVLFVASFGMIAALVASLPNLFIPHSISDLPALTTALSAYRASSTFAEIHLFVVLSFLFLWKQCFSIPGSDSFPLFASLLTRLLNRSAGAVLTNILFGALYGTGSGTTWACLWTAGGSTGAYYIARIISPLVEHYLSTPLGMTRRALNLPLPNATSVSSAPTASKSDLFSHLLLARFFPLLPYSVLNVRQFAPTPTLPVLSPPIAQVISGVLGLPVSLFFITLVIGSFPFNFATVSIGELVALAASDPSSSLTTKIWSPAVLQKLVLVTLISVLPVVFKKQLQRWASSPELRAILGAAPTHARHIWGRVGGALARRVFGYAGQNPALTGPVHVQRASGGRGGNPFRHKYNPSTSSDMGRWDGDVPGDSAALLA